MTDIKDTTFMKRIQRVKIMLVIYGVFGFFFGIYIFAYTIYDFFHTEATFAIIGLPISLTMTLSCIFGGLKEIDAAAKLKENILLGARDGILGQVLISVPSALFVYGMLFEYTIITYIIPLFWLLYNPVLFFNLLSLKKLSQIKQSPSSK